MTVVSQIPKAGFEPAPAPPLTAPLVDPFGRAISYLRVSVTDRCDMRCVYCMSEDMNFLPKRDLLTLEGNSDGFSSDGQRLLSVTGNNWRIWGRPDGTRQHSP